MQRLILDWKTLIVESNIFLHLCLPKMREKKDVLDAIGFGRPAPALAVSPSRCVCSSFSLGFSVSPFPSPSLSLSLSSSPVFPQDFSQYRFHIIYPGTIVGSKPIKVGHNHGVCATTCQKAMDGSVKYIGTNVIRDRNTG